jgi:two-component system, NarL family, sensor histidine kinase UhpB
MLRILCFEDAVEDAMLIRARLLSEGLSFQFDHVISEKEYTDKLKSVAYDLILSDYNLQGFNGIAALIIAKKIRPVVPFICVSGIIGEDLAVELMQLGASDYILKDRLAKLPVAIDRALKEAKAKAARIEAEKEIKNMNKALEKLNQRLIDVREDERASFARELHDQLGQSLTALKIDADWLNAKISYNSEERAKVNEMIKIITSMIGDIQRISSELRPAMLDDIGLVHAVEWYISEFEKRTGINCVINLNEVQFTNKKKNLVMYRILQEALTNVARHSDASKVNINLYRTVDSIILEVFDNGKGIEKEKINSYKSLGFIGIRERLKQHNGSLDIQSKFNKETRLTVAIPFI